VSGQDEVTVRRLDETAVYGWAVTATRRGRERAVALTCGGALGNALATLCARHAAEAYRIDQVEIDDALLEAMSHAAE